MKYRISEDTFNQLNELLNCLNKQDKIYHKVVLEKLEQLLSESEEELSQFFGSQDNPSSKDTYPNVSSTL